MSRNPYIDALRGLSIILVVVLHVQIRLRLQDTFLFRDVSEIWWAFWCRNGHNGVRIFFVISGFLITSTSLSRWGSLERIDVRRFYRLRFARIGPPLLLVLAVLSGLHLIEAANYTIDPAKATLGRAIFSVLALHLNWLEAQVGYLPASWDVLWSLSVEEAFYLFFPLACLALGRRAGRGGVLVLLALLIAVAPVFRAFEQNRIWNMKAYLACFDAIALGCLAAAWLHQRMLHQHTLPRRARPLLAVTGAALVLTVLALERQPVFAPLNDSGLSETILGLGVAALLIAAARADISPVAARWLRPLAACGRLSYEIYLTHMFVVFAALSVFTSNALPLDAAPLMVGIILVLSWGLGALVERYVSGPSNHWLRGDATPAFAVRAETVSSPP